MKLRVSKYILIVLLAFFYTYNAKSQQNALMSMYMLHQPYINPASIASYETPVLSVVYRKQWAGLAGSPSLNQGNFIYPARNKKSFFGLNYRQYKHGVSKDINLSLSYSYKLKLTEYSRLAFGLTGTYEQISDNYNELRLTDSDDSEFLFNNSNSQPNFSFGLYYFQSDFYIGTSIVNLMSVRGDDSRFLSYTHYNFHIGRTFYLNRDFDVNLSSRLKYISNLPLLYDLNAQLTYKNDLGVGLSYRSSNSIAVILNYKFKDKLTLAYAYDINTGETKQLGSGSHEIMLIYNLKERKSISQIEPQVVPLRF